MAVLPKRFGRFGLTLHPDKTRLVRFERPALSAGKRRDDDSDGEGPGSFNFMGFTCHWGRSRQGNWGVTRKTAKDRMARAITRTSAWCRDNRHEPLGKQHAALSRKLQGHYAYYGVTGNMRSLVRFANEVGKTWRYWLARRSGHAKRTWEWFNLLLRRLPLPAPRIVHRVIW